MNTKSTYMEWSDDASKLFKSIMPTEMSWHNPMIVLFHKQCDYTARSDDAIRVYPEHVSAVARIWMVEAFKLDNIKNLNF